MLIFLIFLRFTGFRSSLHLLCLLSNAKCITSLNPCSFKSRRTKKTKRFGSPESKDQANSSLNLFFTSSPRCGRTGFSTRLIAYHPGWAEAETLRTSFLTFPVKSKFQACCCTRWSNLGTFSRTPTKCLSSNYKGTTISGKWTCTTSLLFPSSEAWSLPTQSPLVLSWAFCTTFQIFWWPSLGSSPIQCSRNRQSFVSSLRPRSGSTLATTG